MTAHTPEESEAADAAIQRAVKEAKRAARRFARHRKKHTSTTQQRGQPPKRSRPKTGNGASPREKRRGRARRAGTDDAAAAAEPSATADAAAQRALEKAQRAARCPARHRNTGGAAAAAEPSGRALVVVDPQRSAHCGLHAINNDSDDPASDDSDDNMYMYNEAKAPGATCDPTIHAKPRLATLPHPTPPHLHPTQPNQPTPPLQDEGVTVCL